MANGKVEIVLVPEFSQELTDALETLKGAGISEAFKRRFESFDGLIKLTSVDGEFGVAGGAREVRVLFEPSDLLREFLATVAGNVDGLVVN